MMYLASPSLQTMPVPGIGFCSSIFVDRGEADRGRRTFWSSAPERGAASTDRMLLEAADVAAAASRLG